MRLRGWRRSRCQRGTVKNPFHGVLKRHARHGLVFHGSMDVEEWGRTDERVRVPVVYQLSKDCFVCEPSMDEANCETSASVSREVCDNEEHSCVASVDGDNVVGFASYIRVHIIRYPFLVVFKKRHKRISESRII